jgi:FKBP-type peptidyl-prolyl cis-trans isomerase
MKTRILIPGALALGLTALAHAAPKAPEAPAKAAEKPAAESAEKPAEKPAAAVDPAVVKADSSYALGFRTGGSFGQEYGRFGVTAADIEAESFAKGFFAALKGGKPELSEEKLQNAMKALGDLLQKREQEVATKNLEEGKKFLEENGKRKEVTTTKSGLQYEVLAKGGDKKYEAPKEAPKEGEAAPPEKQFDVRYKGTLINGTEFDASPEGQTVPMTLQVIEGFKEALTTMPVGAKWKLFIPSNLAYGEQRRSVEIGPNQTLVFELELVEIKDAPARQGGFPFPGMEGGAPQGE